MPRAVSPEIIAHVRDTLDGCTASERTAAVNRLAAHYGVSRQTVWRWAEKAGIRVRAKRSDKGTTSCPEEIIERVAALVFASRRISNHHTLPVEDAVQMLIDQGVDVPVSAARMTAILRERGISARDFAAPSPHVRMRADHPNAVWQYDITNCMQYFLDDGGVNERNEELELSKNKVADTARKSMRRVLLRHVAVDAASGAFYFRYYYTSGETAADAADFLFHAMRPKDDLVKTSIGVGLAGIYPFRGVPFTLLTDKGSAMVAKRNANLFAALGMNAITHMPGNPRAKGMVEGLNKILLRFEARLKFQRPRSLEELNAWALDWTIRFSAEKKFRGVASRSALWSRITPDELRECPEESLYRTLIREPEVRRKVDGACTIRLDGRQYVIPDPAAARKEVLVVRNAYEAPAVDVHFNGHVWLCHPVGTDAFGQPDTAVSWGTYKAHPETKTQKGKKRLEDVATESFGVGFKGTGDKRRAETPAIGAESTIAGFGGQAEHVAGITHLPKIGKTVSVDDPHAPLTRPNRPTGLTAPVDERKVSIADVLKQARMELGAVSPEANRALKAAWPGGVPASMVAEVIEKMASGEPLAGDDEGAVRRAE